MKLKLMLGLAVSTLGVGAAQPAAATTDWPQWQGPNRDNLSAETGLLKAWPADGPALAWKAENLGGGFSSVSVSDGEIFTIGDLGEAACVEALDLTTGKLRWKTRLGPIGGGGGYPGPRGTPTVDGKLVYALGQFGDLVCLQAADGHEVWRKNINRDLAGKMMSGWGNAESVLVDGDKLLCTPGGHGGTLVALNKKNGATLWRSTELKDNATYASLIAVDIAGARQAIVLTDMHVAGIAVASGKVLWKAERAGKVAVIPTPIYKDNQVFVASGYGIGCNAFKITAAGGKYDAAQIYANTDMVNHHGGVILLNDNLYGFSDKGGWTCMDFKTGKVVWCEKKLGKGTLSYADGHFYLRDEGTGTLVLIEATPDGWKESGRFNQPDRSKAKAWPHTVISNGKLFVRDQGTLLCYDIQQK
jgi:outer membrane protein assembly factor BamB